MAKSGVLFFVSNYLQKIEKLQNSYIKREKKFKNKNKYGWKSYKNRV